MYKFPIQVTTFHLEKGGCEVRKAGRLLILVSRGDGDAASDEKADAAASEILGEIEWAFRIFFSGGLEELARDVLPGQEDLFHRKVTALLTRIVAVIAGRRTQNRRARRSCRERSARQAELLISRRAAWKCLRHASAVGVVFKDGDEVTFSTLAEGELRVLQYFDLSLTPSPYERRDVGFEMPSGTNLIHIHDADGWLVGRRFSDWNKTSFSEKAMIKFSFQGIRKLYANGCHQGS